MGEVRRRIGVLDMRRGTWPYALYDADGRVTREGELDSPLPDPGNCILVLEFLQRRLGESAVELEAWVFVSATIVEQPAHVEQIAASPVTLYRVTSVSAAAAAQEGGRRVQIVDEESRRWWLVDARGVGSPSISSAPWDCEDSPLESGAALLVSFGYETIVRIGATGNRQSIWGTKSISGAELLQGARMAALRHASGSVCLERDSRNHQVMRLKAQHDTSFAITRVESPVFSPEEPTLSAAAEGRPVLIIVDANVDEIHGAAIDKYAATRLKRAGKIRLDAREQRKRISTALRLCKVASEMRLPRNGIFVAVGGGVTLDIVGFAASLYYRGAGYIRIPTSLVGIIDAGLGVKQAVNFAGKKNVIGTYYAPAAVICDSTFLSTLPLEEVSHGLSEIIKMAMIRDARLYDLLVSHGPALRESHFAEPKEVATAVLQRSSLLMLEELQPNLHESDSRRIVDFGHTFSPIIEALSGYTIAHGSAVATDMVLSTAVAVRLGLCSEDVLRSLQGLLRSVVLPAEAPPCSVEELAGALVVARQRRGGALNLVVPTAIGLSGFVQDVSRKDLGAAMALIPTERMPRSRGIRANTGI